MRFSYFFFILFSIFTKFDLSAQTSNAFVNKSGMFVGDQAEFSIFVQGVCTGNEIISISWDTLTNAKFEILNKAKVESNSPCENRFTATITTFESGELTIPPLAILVTNDELDTIPIFTQAIKLNVFAIEPDSTGLLPIKDIIIENKDFSDYYLYFFAVLGIFLAIGIFSYWKNKKMRQEATLYQQSQTPKAKALRRLEKLESIEILNLEDSKYFSTEISDLLRKFLSEEYNFPAMKMTTKELILFCKENNILPNQHQDLQQILNITDYVKFANGDAQSLFYKQTISTTRKMILLEKEI